MDSSNETVSLDGRNAFQSLTDECQLDVDYTFEESDKEEMTLAQRLKNFTPCTQYSIALCPKCFIQFHNTQRTPLLLPSCGHTVCYPCIQGLRKIEMSLACPVCEIVVTANIQCLPINYALLDLIEKENRKCEKHDLEFAGYCKNDGFLLCGACILIHKHCDLCLLSETELEEVFDGIKKGLKEKINELNTWKQSWEEGKNEFNTAIKEIESEVQTHKSRLKTASEKLIMDIEFGSLLCQHELNEQFAREVDCFSREINSKISDSMKEKLKAELDLEGFDSMNLVQKLAVNAKETAKSEINLKRIKAFHETLKADFDYEERIKKNALNFIV